MSHTITVRLSEELADWVARLASETGVPQGQLVREQLEKARASGAGQPFLRLAGCVKGRPRDLSARKGFSGK
jgi:hypothetical protein